MPLPSCQHLQDEELFTAVLERPAAERAAFLDGACHGDGAQRARLEALLAAHHRPNGLMGPVTRDRAALPPEEVAGNVIGRYKLLEKLGEGGCGAVWAAEQREPVKRRVALKIIKLGMDTQQVIARFEAERQALAMMDHPNIARMLDAGATETGRPYFVMELVRGIKITAYCDENNLSTKDRLELAIQVCHAIQHAHQKGIIHRDIKPSNVLVTLHDGVPVPKVIDFGIAKATQQELTEKTIYTRFQQFIGTPAYMSPEQAEMSGLDIDTRSDVYSLGVLVYELVTGRTPFDSRELHEQGVDQIRRTIREKDPPSPSKRLKTLQHDELTTAARRRSTDSRKLTASVRGDLDWIVMKCLEKDRTRRYETANGLAMDLQRYLAHEPVVARPPSAAYRLRKFARRHRVGLAAAGLVTGVVVIGAIATAAQATRALRAERQQNELREAARLAQAKETEARRAAEVEQQRSAKMRWARETALPEINRLIGKDDISAAFALACEAEPYLADDPALMSLWPRISASVTIETTPAGADIHLKPYRNPAAEWTHLGKSPVRNVRLARDMFRWQIMKEGYADLESADGPLTIAAGTPPKSRFQFTLHEVSSAPPAMVHIRGGRTETAGPQGTQLPSVQLADYWIDKYEVTNRRFKEFVDAGGYSTQKWWRIPFVKGDKTIGWREAMALFHDTTGLPGPATWRNGTYAEGESEHPVTGVSWFEAAAYAEFAGKRLPSIYHWRQAATAYYSSYIVPLSCFGGNGPAAVGQHQGMSLSGAYDMAGNAKEWCWNEANDGKRYILGAGWREPEYMFSGRDAQSPFDRIPTYGFRCIKLAPPGEVAAGVDAPLLSIPRSYRDEKPVGDAEFEVIKRMFAYDRTRLEPQVESVDDRHERRRKERVSFRAAYNEERMAAFLFVPKKVAPPYQAVVYFPGATALSQRSSDKLVYEEQAGEFTDHGRAVIYPVYQGTYERGPRLAGGDVATREWRIHLAQDLGRAIDYLETRSDIRVEKLAYVGYSWGAALGAMIPAVEPRIKASVLIIGGFYSGKFLPEADPFNFAPRVRIPTLMLNGRYDFSFQLEASQQPMFRWLGTPTEHKRHVLYDTGHSVPKNQSLAEALAWLDRYLGPVK